jgi:excisionase family DNA binding protein
MTDVVARLVEELAAEVADRAEAILRERLEAVEREPESAYMTVPEAAELLRAKPQRVYDLLSARRLTRHKDGSRVLVLRAELESHLRGVAHPLPHRRQSRMNTRFSR